MTSRATAPRTHRTRASLLGATVTLAVTAALVPGSLGSTAGAERGDASSTSSAASAEASAQAKQVRRPLVIGHRGASGHRPEHTLASYRTAIRMGADYVEPDLVSTKDGVLVARHENEISGTTDVADRPRFADRRTTKRIDGVEYTGWFTEDFTLRELKRLRAVERLPDVRPRNTRFDGRFQVPTFAEILQMVRRHNNRTDGRDVGVYVETKHPSYHDRIGLSLEEPMVRVLRRQGFDKRTSKVFLQSFETTNLRQLDRVTDLPLVQLMDATGGPWDLRRSDTTWAELAKPRGLRGIARYADAIGPNKDLVIPRRPDGSAKRPSPLVRDAHREDLLVHPFTIRDENQFMATDFRRGNDPNAKGDVRAEILAFLDAGVDGFFTDYPDTGVAARNAWLRANR